MFFIYLNIDSSIHAGENELFMSFETSNNVPLVTNEGYLLNLTRYAPPC
jgi:hypothetical protein